MKISIIGSGWLAQPLASQLQQDHQVTMTSTQAEKVTALKAQGHHAMQYVLGDQLSNPDKLFSAELMIIAVTSKELEGFQILLDQLSAFPDLQIIYISSTSVYQNNQQNHNETSSSLNHDNPTYLIEQVIQTHPTSSIIRFAGLVGPDRHPGRFFKDKAISNPDAPVNLIHLDDCIGLIKAVFTNQAWHQIFNGCADNHPSKAEFYSHATKLANLPEPAIEPSDSGNYKTIDNTKSKTVLNHQYIHPNVMGMTF